MAEQDIKSMMSGIVCLLVWLAAGFVLSVPEKLFCSECFLWFWKCAETLGQSASVFVCAKALGLSAQSCGLCRADIKKAMRPAFACLCVAAAFAVLVPTSQQVLPGGKAAIFLAFLQMCPLSALSEELAFRGCIQGAMHHSAYFDLLVPAALFAAAHSTGTRQLYAFFIGLCLGWMRMRCGSIWPCFVVHCINNIIVFAFLFLGGN